MKLAASIARSLQADLQAELRDVERAVAIGTPDAGRGLKTQLRRQVGSAGLGQRLACSWRDQHYPMWRTRPREAIHSSKTSIRRSHDRPHRGRAEPR
jgi:Family of unknown function (DUF6441)